MKYEISRGPHCQSKSMYVRRIFSKFPIVGRIAPNYWHFDKLDFIDYFENHYNSYKIKINEPYNDLQKSHHREMKYLAEICVKESPSTINAWEACGLSSLKLGLYEQSANYFRLLTEIRKDCPSYIMLGDATRDHSEKLSSYRKAADIDPKNFSACDSLSRELAFQENYREAINVILSFFDDDVICWYSLGYLAIYSINIKDLNSAEKYLFQALEMDTLKVMQWFEQDLSDACVGHENFSMKIFKYVKNIDKYAASQFIKFYARRQVAFNQGVEVWNADEDAVILWLKMHSIPLRDRRYEL